MDDVFGPGWEVRGPRRQRRKGFGILDRRGPGQFSAKRVARPKAPNPIPARWRNWRRVRKKSAGLGACPRHTCGLCSCCCTIPCRTRLASRRFHPGMSAISYLKCSCQQCGRHIEFPADAIGTSVDCPHCGWPTELTFRPAGTIGAIPRNLTWPVIGLCVLLFGIIASVVGLRMVKQLALRTDLESLARWRPNPRTTRPRPDRPRSPPRVSRPTIYCRRHHFGEAKDSNFVYVIGSVKNETERQRFGVRVTWTFSISPGQSGPGFRLPPNAGAEADWHFKASSSSPMPPPRLWPRSRRVRGGEPRHCM